MKTVGTFYSDRIFNYLKRKSRNNPNQQLNGVKKYIEFSIFYFLKKKKLYGLIALGINRIICRICWNNKLWKSRAKS